MPRWKLIISGRVQTAGYRAMVKNIALGLRVKGVARNLDDGTVEIFCEASSESFERFKEAINVKSGPENIFAPSVEEFTVYDGDSPGYGTPPDEYFKAFRIDYSGVDPETETLERSEMGIIALGTLNRNLVAMHTDLKEGFRETGEGLREVKVGLDRVEGAVSGMHTDMNTRFDTLDDKYGEFGEKMTTLEHNISELTWQIKRLVDHVVGEETGKDSE